jgi:hypothetical protein
MPDTMISSDGAVTVSGEAGATPPHGGERAARVASCWGTLGCLIHPVSDIQRLLSDIRTSDIRCMMRPMSWYLVYERLTSDARYIRYLEVSDVSGVLVSGIRRPDIRRLGVAGATCMAASCSGLEDSSTYLRGGGSHAEEADTRGLSPRHREANSTPDVDWTPFLSLLRDRRAAPRGILGGYPRPIRGRDSGWEGACGEGETDAPSLPSTPFAQGGTLQPRLKGDSPFRTGAAALDTC